MSDNKRRVIGWSRSDIEEVVSEVTGRHEMKTNNNNGITWKVLVPVLLALFGVAGGAFVQASLAKDCATAAGAEASKKLGKEQASDKYFPLTNGVRLQEQLEQVKATLDKHSELLREILERLPKRRHR